MSSIDLSVTPIPSTNIHFLRWQVNQTEDESFISPMTRKDENTRYVQTRIHSSSFSSSKEDMILFSSVMMSWELKTGLMPLTVEVSGMLMMT